VNLALLDINLGCAGTLDLDTQTVEVIRTVAQMGPRFLDIANQQIGNGHARIRRLGLVAHEYDAIEVTVLANGLSSNDTGWSGAQDDMLHGDVSLIENGSDSSKEGGLANRLLVPGR
jgi:hypothetical protein